MGKKQDNFFDNIFDDQDVPKIIEIIDTDAIEKGADNDAAVSIDHLTSKGLPPELLKEQPKIVEHINNTRQLLKRLNMMLASNDTAHRLILKGIEQEPTSAALYRALTDIQKTILSIQEQRTTCITNLETYLKSIQLELNFADNVEEEEDTPSKTSRGSKEFIESIKNQINNE